MNSATVQIAIEVDDRGSVKIRNLGKAAQEAGRDGAKGFDQMKKSLDDTDQSVNRASASMKMLGAVAAAVAASAVVSALVGIGKEAIKLASDLEETQGKFNVVFQGMTSQAETWSRELQSAFAMSELESKRYMASIQNMLVPTGMMRGEAGKLSFDLTKLAADLGSFNNLPTAKVFEDIMSALQGSSETMDKYGINVRESKVQQEAFTLGLAKTKDEISDADRMMATYSLIVKQAGDAIGDMSRTSESYANQQKRLSAEVENLKTAFGEALLPAVTSVVKEMNTWLAANGDVLKQDLKTWAEFAAGAINALVTAAHAGAVAIDAIAKAWGALKESQLGAGEAMLAEAGQASTQKLVSSLSVVDGAFDSSAIAAAAYRSDLSAAIDTTGDFSHAANQATGEFLNFGGAAGKASGQVDGHAKALGKAAEEAKYAGEEYASFSQEVQRLESTNPGAALAIIEKNLGLIAEGAKEAEENISWMSDAYDELGLMSEESYQKQVKAAEDAYDRIVAAHGDGSAEQIRAAEALHKRQVELTEDYTGKAVESTDIIAMAWEDLTEETKGVLHEWVESAIKLEFDSVSDAFESLCDAMLNVFIDMIAKMIAEWAMAGIAGMIAGNGLDGFSWGSIGSAIGGGSGGGGGLSTLGTAASIGKTGYELYTGESLTGTALSSAAEYLGLKESAAVGTKLYTGSYTFGEGVGAVGAGTGATLVAGSAPIGIGASYLGGASTVGASTSLTGATWGYGGYGAAQAGGYAGIGAAGGSGAGAAGGGAAAGGTGAGTGAAGLSAIAIPVAAIAAVAAIGYFGSKKEEKNPAQSEWSGLLHYGEQLDTYNSIGPEGPQGFSQKLTAGAFNDAFGGGTPDTFGEAAEKAYQDLLKSEKTMAALGAKWGELSKGMEDSIPSFDNYLDSVTGVNIATEDSARIHKLAQQAVNDNGASFELLTNELQAMGMSEEMARASAIAMTSAIDDTASSSDAAGNSLLAAASGIDGVTGSLGSVENAAGGTSGALWDMAGAASSANNAIDSETGSMLDLTSGAGSATSAVQGMTSSINTLSNTPLNIDVRVRQTAFTAGDYRDFLGQSYHADGGIFPGATLIPSINGYGHVVAEAGYPEAIIPLPRGARTMAVIEDKIDNLRSSRQDDESRAILLAVARYTKKAADVLQRFEYTGIPASTRQAAA